MQFKVILFQGEAKALSITKALGSCLATPQNILRETSRSSTYISKVQQVLWTHECLLKGSVLRISQYPHHTAFIRICSQRQRLTNTVRYITKVLWHWN